MEKTGLLACPYIGTKHTPVLEILALKKISTSKYQDMLKYTYNFFYFREKWLEGKKSYRVTEGRQPKALLKSNVIVMSCFAEISVLTSFIAFLKWEYENIFVCYVDYLLFHIFWFCSLECSAPPQHFCLSCTDLSLPYPQPEFRKERNIFPKCKKSWQK